MIEESKQIHIQQLTQRSHGFQKVITGYVSCKSCSSSGTEHRAHPSCWNTPYMQTHDPSHTQDWNQLLKRRDTSPSHENFESFHRSRQNQSLHIKWLESCVKASWMKIFFPQICFLYHTITRSTLMLRDSCSPRLPTVHAHISKNEGARKKSIDNIHLTKTWLSWIKINDCRISPQRLSKFIAIQG